MSLSIFTEGMIVNLFTILLEKHPTWRRWLDELIFLVPYSLLMQFFATIYRAEGVDQLGFIPRLLLDVLGLIISFAGIAMYSDCAWCFHPHDVLSSCLKIAWTPKLMKLFNLVVPLLVIAICFCKNHTVYALHIGTLIGIFLQSKFTEYFQIEYSRYLHI